MKVRKVWFAMVDFKNEELMKSLYRNFCWNPVEYGISAESLNKYQVYIREADTAYDSVLSDISDMFHGNDTCPEFMSLTRKLDELVQWQEYRGFVNGIRFGMALGGVVFPDSK